MKSLSIRWKLTLWYGGVLAMVLLIFSLAVFFTMRHQLLERIDQGLDEELADVLYEIGRAKDSATLLGWLERRFARHEGFDFQITKDDGQPFFVSHRLGETSFPLPDGTTTTPTYDNVEAESGGRWRIVNVIANGPDGPLTVQVARSLAAFDHETHELLITFALTGPLTLMIAVGGGYLLARRALAPVQKMTETAKQISADRLERRVPIQNPDDELGALGQTLNQMIERLEQSFSEMQRFTADAAHELRTPLAVMRNEAEVALRSSRSSEEYCHVLGNLLEETNRLANMADQLLFLSRQDAGLYSSVQEDVAADELLREVIANMQLVAQEKGVSLELVENQPCRLLSDSRLLRRLFYNLVDNAIKYTPLRGSVSVRSNVLTEQLCVIISDTGVGIPAEHLPRVFDRFYRADPARTGDNGAGLGLAICQSIAKALGGRLELESVVGKGTKVTVLLPLT